MKDAIPQLDRWIEAENANYEVPGRSGIAYLKSANVSDVSFASFVALLSDLVE